MKVASLFSGGKDSIFAIYIAQQWGWEVTNLITLQPRNTSSWMFHSINIHLTEKIAKAINMPLIKKITKGEKEEELNDLKHILKKLPIEGVISGAIASEYQRTRIEKICNELNLKSFTPLWHKNQELIVRNQINAGFKIALVGIYAEGFDKSWLGKIMNEELILKLKQLRKKYLINIAGEGGEYETLVLDGPIFKKKLVIDKIIKEWKRDSGGLIVKKAHLEGH
jgi:ABC transporter with metal-binding/Fe-S-binding domain ATP-binding protein